MNWKRLLVVTPLLFSLAGPTVANADWVSAISAANPLHWYRFEEATGASAADDQGSADADGTYVGNVSLQTPGLVGNAAAFDGGVDAVLVAAQNLVGDWTVETILKADVINGGPSQGIVGTDFSASNVSPRVAIKAEQYEQTGQLGYTLFSSFDVTFGAPAAATPANYKHVVFVATASGVELFVNGSPVGSDPSVIPLSRHVLAASAMRSDGALVDPLTGSIDELVIYDRALSPLEIASHARTIPEPSVVGLILFAMVGGSMIRRI